MCGITGVIEIAPEAATLAAHCEAMLARLPHRGPDDRGLWTDAAQGVAFGHARLAIVDLSAAGHQPMVSAGARYVIVFNGEIYNHLAVREQLPGVAWRGHSDTETLLAACEAWGVRGAVERCHGMFAFALWDRHEQVLTLARDRLGEKPLYFGWQGQGAARSFLFGSELKALRAHPSFEGRIDRRTLPLLLRHNYVPSPYSVYEGISKLPPGHMLQVSRSSPEPRLAAYWSAADVARRGVAEARQQPASAWVDELDVLLKSAIGRQMMSDVPLGAFLSGGIDSSLVVALMQSISSTPVRSFTIGFHEPGYNEAEHAKAVARHLGTSHTELYVTPTEAMAVIPNLPRLYDEPFSDSSQIPTFLVSQLARRDVTVSLSGDAGDELFAGYNRYTVTHGLWNRLQRIPLPLRRAGAAAIGAASPAALDRAGRMLAPLLPRSLRMTAWGDKPHKAAGLLALREADQLYLGMVSHWADPESVVVGGHEPPTQLTGDKPAMPGLDPLQRMMLLDTLTYLPDDILVKVDRAAMGVSLETRVPFLDPTVVEFAWRMPMDCKLRDGQSKWALRQVLYRYVPRELIDRPKMGFGVPIDRWLRGPLREWAEALLDPSRLHHEGFFQAEPIRRKWDEHLSGQRNWQYHMWDILMFQQWQEAQAGALA